MFGDGVLELTIWEYSMYSGHRTKVDKDCDLWCAGKEKVAEARDWGKYFILERLKRLIG